MYATYSGEVRWTKRIDPGSEEKKVKDTTIKSFIDGGLVLDKVDNRYLSGSEVGLWGQNVQLTVVSFKVTAL